MVTLIYFLLVSCNMVKVHTRVKRKIGPGYNSTRTTRPKTFNNEDSANKYAKDKGIKDYTLVNMSIGPSTPKLKIVEN